MLKDRIKMTDTGFRVFQEEGADRRVYYREFTLKEAAPEGLEFTEMAYWNPVTASEITLNNKRGSFVCVTEKEDGILAETHSFYFSAGRKKSQLAITMKPKPFYGKGACMITLEWINCKAEPIHSHYIALKGEDGERYNFLGEVVEPLKPDGKHLMDQYVFTLPSGHKPEDYTVEVAPLVLEKYRIL